MCWFCDKYGDGGVWYLNPKNYARQLYRLRRPGQNPAPGRAEGGEGRQGRLEARLVDLMEKDPEEYKKALAEAYEREKWHGEQVVPLRDAEKMMDLASPIGLMSCPCRRAVRGVEETKEEEYTCMGLGVGMFKWERWPETYKGGVHFLSPEEGKQWLRKLDKKGFVHLLMPGGEAPYIGGFCQCEYPLCFSIRRRLDFGLRLIKGHHVAFVNYDKCTGCALCIKRCQFGAMWFEVRTNLAHIDQHKCFGCGLCETQCPSDAIYLRERQSLPALREVW